MSFFLDKELVRAFASFVLAICNHLSIEVLIRNVLNVLYSICKAPEEKQFTTASFQFTGGFTKIRQVRIEYPIPALILDSVYIF